MLIDSRLFWTRPGTPAGCPTRSRGAAAPAIIRAFLVLLWTAAALAAASPIRVENAALHRAHGLYLLDATVRFGIIGEPLKALKSGVPLTLLLEAEILEVRDYLWDKRIGGARQRYRVEHRALSGHYLVTNLVTGLQDSYPSIEDTADALGELRDIPVIDEQRIRAGRRYLARVRAGIDRSALPGPLRLASLLSSEWRVESAWYRFELSP